MFYLNRASRKAVLVAGFFFAIACTVRADSFSYELSESVSCLKPSCSGTISVVGSLTVDQSGSLSGSDFVDWDLSIGSGDLQAAKLNTTNSTLSVSGSPVITADTSGLNFTINETNDGIVVWNTTSGAQWIFGAFTSPAEVVNFPAGHGKTYTGVNLLEFPASFTAHNFGVAPRPPQPGASSPEPASLFFVTLGLALSFVGCRKN